jgi:hypothetical protein
MFAALGLFLFLACTNHASSMYLGQNWGNVLGAERIEQPRCVSIPQNFSLCHGIQVGNFWIFCSNFEVDIF